jgi:DNA-binding NtrC family response regulator
LITRACVLSQGTLIAASDIQPWLRPSESSGVAPLGAPTATVGARLEDLERATIVATLQKFAGNRAKTAAALGIGVRTLSGKLRAYGFAPRTREFAIGAHRQELPAISAEFADRARQSA